MNNRISSTQSIGGLIHTVYMLFSYLTTPYQKISDGLILHVNKSGYMGKHSFRLSLLTTALSMSVKSR